MYPVDKGYEIRAMVQEDNRQFEPAFSVCGLDLIHLDTDNSLFSAMRVVLVC